MLCFTALPYLLALCSMLILPYSAPAEFLQALEDPRAQSKQKAYTASSGRERLEVAPLRGGEGGLVGGGKGKACHLVVADSGQTTQLICSTCV